MNKDSGVRFILDDDKKACNFVYRPPGEPVCDAQNATLGVKFAQSRRILDDWYLIGGTRWSRALFRLKHPIVYSKRGLRNLYRRVKHKIFGDPPMILCRKRISKKEALKHWPNKHD